MFPLLYRRDNYSTSSNHSSISRWNWPWSLSKIVTASPTTVAAAAFVVLGCGTCLAYQHYHNSKQFLQHHGWKGAVRYLWEGDPHTPDARDLMNALDQAEDAMERKLSAPIYILEISLERAKLDTIHDATAGNVVELWSKNVPKSMRDLRQRLALLSHDADKIAASIDEVTIPIHSNKDDESEVISAIVAAELRQRKKSLSIQVVELMQRLDELIAFFKLSTIE